MGTLLCVYQATLHFIALPVLVMLLILDWSSIVADTDRSPGRNLILACMSMCGMAMMYAFDRKLSKGGIIGSVVAMVLIGLARSVDAWVKACCDARSPSCVRWHSSFTAPLLVVVISTALIRRYEHPIYTPAGPVSLGGILAFNVACVLAAWRCNMDFFTQMETSDDEISSEYFGGKELKYLVHPLAVVGLVTAGNNCILPPCIVSTWQHIGFLIAMSAIYIASHTPRRVSAGDTEKNYELLAEAEPRDPPEESTGKTCSKRIMIALGITALAGFLCFLLPSYWPSSTSNPSQTTLELSAISLPRKDGTYSLDFVISRYDESATSLADNLAPLLTLPTTSSRETRIIVYNTGNDTRNSTFPHDLQHALPSNPQITIHHRENVGREGAAFLHHITTQWDNLADHTLFMQAQPHQPGHMRRLLRNYFVPQTGFLSLSALQDSCTSCEDCWDHSTWSESQNILEDIYSRANKGAECKNFVLTYRGQFVASRNRIQAPGKGLFEDLLDGMVNAKSDKHSGEYVSQPWLPQKIDSLNSPLFGYTLERIWGILMGCSDQRLALKCPSRLAAALGVMKVGSPGLLDCQCLDEGS